MERKSSVVTQMQTNNNNNSLHDKMSFDTDRNSISAKKFRLSRTLVKGIAKLVRGQKQFAAEFGLTNARVFPRTYHLMDGQSSDKLLKQMFRSGETGIEQIQHLFNDMVDHQLALFNAIDSVALQTLLFLCPENVNTEDPRRFITDGGKWRFYKKYHKEFQINTSMRFNQVVAPGFVASYTMTREKYNK